MRIPADRQGELDIVAACLQEPRHVPMAISAGVDVAAFTECRCRWIWPTLANVYGPDPGADAAVFVAALERAGPISTPHKQWIVRLATGLRMRGHWPVALGRILEARRKRELIITAHRIIMAARASEVSDDTITAARRALDHIMGDTPCLHA
jgi:hypothetical protein